MVEEEGSVMGGLLVGLNVIDANLCIKGEDLDSQVSSDGLFSPQETSRSIYTVIIFSALFRLESLTSPFI